MARLKDPEKEKLVSDYVKELADQLTEEFIKIKGKPLVQCPQCKEQLSRDLKALIYSSNVADPRVICPKCTFRFHPRLVVGIPNKGDYVFNLLSDKHTIFYLRDWSDLKPREIFAKNPGVYFSAIYNFGSIENAYKKSHVRYKHPEIPIWSDLVVPYLGKISDHDIASCVITTPDAISILRRSLGIRKYNKLVVLKELLKKVK